MIYIATEGLSDDERKALVERTAKRVNAAVAVVFEGVDSINTAIIRALLTFTSAQENPSYDGRVSMLMDAFMSLLGAAAAMNPSGADLWDKKAAEYRAAYDAVVKEIQTEQAVKLN